MDKLSVTFKVITPLFMSGFKDRPPEIRGASIKGALRYWYRAILLSRENAWERVKSEEARVFGSAGDEGSGSGRDDHGRGQANVLLKVLSQGNVSRELTTQNKHGLIYLGYGPINFKGVQQDFIAPGSRFELILAFKRQNPGGDKRGLTERDIRDLELAIQALGYFGGLGSRSRRGFGSANIIAWSASYDPVAAWQIPRDVEDLQKKLRDWQRAVTRDSGGRFFVGQPEYTAFSTLTRTVVTGAKKDALEALNEIGRSFLTYRTSGQSGGKTGVPPKENRVLPWRAPFLPKFWDDHDLIASGKPGTHPRRAVFGLPHNYQFTSSKIKADITAYGSGEQRRASPLFIHVQELSGGTGNPCCCVLTSFPARFLPDDYLIRIRHKPSGQVSKCRPQVDYGIIADFLDEVRQSTPSGREVFPVE